MSRRDRVTVRLEADITYDHAGDRRKPDTTSMLCLASAFRRTVLAVICLACCGCTSPREPAVSIDRPALRPVLLPDMTGAADSVQSQLRDRYASLTLKVNDSGTSADDLADAFGAMGRLFVAAEYLDAAESCFANAQSLVPGDMRRPYYLGHVFRLRNEPAKAAGLFAQSLTLEPAYVPTLVWLGEMRLAQNRPDAAERFFKRGLAIQSRSTAALYGLGRAALARQQYAQAVAHLEAALALEPQASRIHDPLAMAYRGLGDLRNADAHLRQRGDVEVSSADPLLEAVAGLLKNAAA
jgi:tetratricopeptide (TPR) repeat protein